MKNDKTAIYGHHEGNDSNKVVAQGLVLERPLLVNGEMTDLMTLKNFYNQAFQDLNCNDDQLSSSKVNV